MNTVSALLLALALGTPRVAHAQVPLPSTTDSARVFPRAEGSNLEGRKFTLPADFEGDYNVVLVAFKRQQQDDVDTWLPYLRDVAARRPDVRVYELPTLHRGYRMMRGFIDGGMARGIPERATREATITLYIDKTPFKQALAIGSEDQISVFLVTRNGHVVWRTSGRFAAEAGAALVAMLR